MKRQIRVSAVAKHLPKGAKLPPRFAAFASAAKLDVAEGPWFHLVWRNPADLQTSSITSSLTPFLGLGDGGVVAFWHRGAGEAPIVHLDSEGGAQAVAVTFADFLGKLARRRTGVPDLDSCKVPLVVPGASAKAAPVKSLHQAFVAAVAAGEPKAATGVDLDRVRARIVAVAAKMIRDGKSKVEKPRDDWKMSYAAERAGASFRLTYVDFGVWYPVPDAYGLQPLWGELVTHCKRPAAKRFELVVMKQGMLSVDRDRQLITFPGGVTLTQYLATVTAAINRRHAH